MNCYVHAERMAEQQCAACGNRVCDDCGVQLAQQHLCRPCLATAESVAPPLEPRAHQRSVAGHSLAGMMAVAGVLGTVMGLVGGGVFVNGGRIQDAESMCRALGAGLASGFATLLVGGLLIRLLLPRAMIHEKKGVLALIGVTDYGLLLFWTAVVAVVAWFCALS